MEQKRTRTEDQGHPDVHPLVAPGNRINVGTTERAASAVLGGLMMGFGLQRRSIRGLLLAAAGGALLYRGSTGHCPMLAAAGVNTADEPFSSPEAVIIEESLTIMKPRDEVYAAWRRLENLPSFMRHIASVSWIDDKRTRWQAKVPGGLGTLEWEAELIRDEPGEHIVWQSLPGATVHNAGSVRFVDSPSSGGTEIHVTIEYRPPAGEIGSAAAGLVNPVLSQMVKEDIRRFKSLQETGEIPTVTGQPAAR
jgi:uncharacterized membrane protein